MKNSALQYALESQGRLGLGFAVFGNARHRLFDELAQFGAQSFDVGATGAQYPYCGWVVEQCQQKMLHRHELMTLGAGLLEGLVESKFKFFAKHDNLAFISPL